MILPSDAHIIYTVLTITKSVIVEAAVFKLDTRLVAVAGFAWEIRFLTSL